MTSNKSAVLLINIGSPAEPNEVEVKQYLKKFLSDSHVVKLPRFIWLPILHFLILPFRAKSSAKLYQQIWQEYGSPLTYFSTKIAEKLAVKLNIPVEVGMNYSEPSISSALKKLEKKKIEKLIVLPLYPQYSTTTTQASFSQVEAALKKWHKKPITHYIEDYADNEHYIAALCQTIKNQKSLNHLVFSFHGIPKRYIQLGDIYYQRCLRTVELITKQLNWTKWSLCFQSRLGRATWLKPYTNELLQSLPKKNINDIHVICPGFAVDCLETLEEIAIRGKKQFLAAGGQSFNYISALNDESFQIRLLKSIVEKIL